MKYTFDEINYQTGFAQGARFKDEAEVWAYFTPENQEAMFGREAEYAPIPTDDLRDMARTVIENRWWMERPILITVREVASRLSLSPGQVRHLLQEGRLQGFKLNRQNWRVRADSVSRFALDVTENGNKDERR